MLHHDNKVEMLIRLPQCSYRCRKSQQLPMLRTTYSNQITDAAGVPRDAGIDFLSLADPIPAARWISNQEIQSSAPHWNTLCNASKRPCRWHRRARVPTVPLVRRGWKGACTAEEECVCHRKTRISLSRSWSIVQFKYSNSLSTGRQSPGGAGTS